MPEKRHEQHVRVRQARRRVAGHAEDRRHADRSKSGRLARFDGDTVKRHRPAAVQRVEHQVPIADGAAAREHDDVARASGVERPDEVVNRVACGRHGGRHAAVLVHDRRERMAIDVINLSRPERRAGIRQLVAGRHDRDRRTRKDAPRLRRPSPPARRSGWG